MHTRRYPLIHALAALTFLAGACDDGPTDADVSETETWRLELEQTRDGTASLYPRRGTINLLLELNHTSSPDPACADTDEPDATAFLADVRALPSRLQESATGTAEGVWNCHGFAATVRLDDGTTFELVSDSMLFLPDLSQPLRRWAYGPNIPDEVNRRFEPHRWSAGARRGHFLFARDDDFAYDPLDSHVDVTVENRRSDDATIATGIAGRVLDLRYSFSNGSGIPNVWEPVPAGGVTSVSWLAHPSGRYGTRVDEIEEYDIYLDGVADTYDEGAYWCYLASDHPDRLRLVIDDDGLECSTGWLEAGQIRISPTWLFRRPGTSALINGTVVPGVQEEYALGVRTSHPTITTELIDEVGYFHLLVTVGPDAPPAEHGVTITGVGEESGDTTYAVTTINVYELDLTIEPDTVTVVQNDSATAIVRLDRAGLIGLDVGLSDGNSVPASTVLRFDPRATAADSAVLTVHAADLAAPGTYRTNVCAMVLADPRSGCHATGAFTLRIDGEPVYDISMHVRANVLGYAETVVGDTVQFTAIAQQSYAPADGVEARAATPAGFVLDSATASHGTYDPATGVWSIGELEAWDGTTGVPTLRLYTTADSVGVFTFEARFTAGTERDANPANNADSITVVVRAAGSASISGAVTVDGTPVTDETVTLAGDADAQTATDGNGEYDFAGLAPGDYTVAVETDLPPGTFPSTSVDVTLAEAEAATVDFTGTTIGPSCTSPTPPVAGTIVFEDPSGGAITPPFAPGTDVRAVPAGFVDNVGGGLSYDWDPAYDGVTPNLTASGPYVEITAGAPGTYGVYVRATDVCHGDPDGPPDYDGTASAFVTYDTSF